MKCAHRTRFTLWLTILTLPLHPSVTFGAIVTNTFTTSSGSFDSPRNGGWWWNNTTNEGLNWTIVDNGMNSSSEIEMFTGFETSYIPFSGNYFMRINVCPSPGGPSRCTVARSVKTIDSNVFSLTSTTKLVDQNPRFIMSSGVIPGGSSICYTFVDDSGHEWSTPAPRTCQDAGTLPDVPSVCYLNTNSDLDVMLGTLERGTIATVPAAGAPGNVKKDVSVLCIRDAGTTVSTTFQYTPLTFNGHEVISTQNNGLGVAVFYKGQLVGPSSAPITETFAVGYTSREFEFQAIRDPAVALNDIPTGNFTANATMIMTQQ